MHPATMAIEDSKDCSIGRVAQVDGRDVRILHGSPPSLTCQKAIFRPHTADLWTIAELLAHKHTNQSTAAHNIAHGRVCCARCSDHNVM